MTYQQYKEKIDNLEIYIKEQYLLCDKLIQDNKETEADYKNLLHEDRGVRDALYTAEELLENPSCEHCGQCIPIDNKSQKELVDSLTNEVNILFEKIENHPMKEIEWKLNGIKLDIEEKEKTLTEFKRRLKEE